MGTKTHDPATLSTILESLQPAPASYLQACRTIESGNFPELIATRLAVMSTFTAEVLRPYLVVEGARRGLRVIPYFAPYNQLEQQALDPASPFYAHAPDAVVIAGRLEELAPDLPARFCALTHEQASAELESVGRRLTELVSAVRERTAAPMFLFNFAPPASLQAGLADASLEFSQAGLIQKANEAAAAACRATPAAFVFDYARLVCELGLRRWSDAKLSYLWRVPFSVPAQIELARRLTRGLRAALQPPCKCLVVDFDNTLWGGVLGEDGPSGIALGEDYPGRVFKDFQSTLLGLTDRGVLLAAASKNTESDVLDVLDKHPDCLLKRVHFSSFQVHWDDKATSLRAIARELNIGLDSLAFFDDNPVERDWIRSQLPEVRVIEVPASPLEFARVLDESGVFDQLTISSEDRARARLYDQEDKRRETLSTATSLEEFLRRLDMTVSIGALDETSLPRVAQLLSKTNQFNLTTRRHTAADISVLLRNGATALWARVKDRFGDSGLVGAAIAVPNPDGSWRIDTFLLSCRVIGRRVETALLAALSEEIRRREGRVLIGEYLPTAKNRPAARFYADHDFQKQDEEGRLWRRDISHAPVAAPQSMTVERAAEGSP